MSVVGFLASRNGRIARGAVGLILAVVGAMLGGAWWVLAVVGLVPLAMGAFDLCLLGPSMHLPMSGRRLRASLWQR